MTLDEYLAIPFVLVIETVQRPDGTWARRAQYPELGCAAEAESAFDALDRLELARISYISSRFQRGETIPAPRPSLRRILAATRGSAGSMP